MLFESLSIQCSCSPCHLMCRQLSVLDRSTGPLLSLDREAEHILAPLPFVPSLQLQDLNAHNLVSFRRDEGTANLTICRTGQSSC